MGPYITPEREEYIHKLESQMQAIDRILRMDTGTVVDQSVKKRLRDLRAESEDVMKKLRNDEFEIAIVGMEKAGKSTFANALMESNLLPAKGPRCTFTSTRIEYSGDGQDDSATVSFYTADTFDRDFKDKLRNLGFPNYERYSFDTLDKALYESIYAEEVSDDKKAAYGESIHKDILAITENAERLLRLLGRPDIHFTSEQIRSGELTAYITDEIKARAARQVVIRSTKLSQMKNAVIFDVPGFNSPTELHKIQTRERMRAADAIIVVANGALPSLTGESLKLLHESDDDGNPLSDKLFVFANRIEDSKNPAELEENIESTYSEWCGQEFVLPSQKHRIIFGSALAHLQSAGLEDGYSALRAFEDFKPQLPHGDGIEDIRRELVNYDRTERTEVLKRRVNRINADIIKAFSEIRRDYTGEPPVRSYGQEHLALVTGFCHDMPPKAEEGLLGLKADIQVYMPSEKPLSRQITEYIAGNVTTEKYGVSDELVKEVKLRTPFPGAFDDTARIEDAIRELKFTEMYDDFSNNVINIADKHHADYFTQILDIVLSSMEIDPNSPYYDDLRTLLRDRLAPYRGELVSMEESSQRTYYQSLIERFSRDIYEVLITSQYNAERLRKFYDSIDNFFSMSVFYKKPGSTDDLSYISVAPQEQPLCMMLLFHHYLHMDDSLRRLSGELSQIAGVEELPEDILPYVEKAYVASGRGTEDLIECARKKLARAADKTDEFRLNLLKNALNEVIECGESCNIADPDSFIRYYKNYHTALRGGRQDSVEDFRREFDKDIEILQDVLTNAFVRAINMEKPFVARETKSIDDIIKHIKSAEFTRFLADNFWKIRYEETAKLDKQHREREQNTAIISEINGILDALNN